MRTWSLKIKVGIYAAFLTMVAFVAGALVMMITLYFHQISGLDDSLHDQVRELVWDLRNFRDSPKNPSEVINARFIPVALREHYLFIENEDDKPLYQSKNLGGRKLEGEVGSSRTARLDGEACRIGSWKVSTLCASVPGSI